MRNALIKARKEIGLTQREVADATGISRSFYGLIEIGLRNHRYEVAKKIAQKVKKLMREIFFDYRSFNLKQRKQQSSSQ